MRYLFLLLIPIVLSGCDSLANDEADDIEYEVTFSDTTPIDGDGIPYVFVTFVHKGGATITGCSCDITAKKNGQVVSLARSQFAYFGQIGPGDSVTDQARFVELSSHEDYDELQSFCTWSKA